MAGAPFDRLESEESARRSTKTIEAWRLGPVNPTLGSAVDIWRIDLNMAEEEIFELSGWLSTDEFERAGRFYFEEHRQKFIAAHGALRDILGRYLRVSPAAIGYQYSPYGKPSLSVEYAESELNFNLSHSHELALVAVGSQAEMGIDIEFMRPDLAGEQIARRFFSQLEIDTYLSLPDELHQAAFFTCWTRKEAYIKARGEGLSMPLDQFDVTITPGGAAFIIETRPDPAQALQWKLYPVITDPGYFAALAVRDNVEEVHGLLWSLS